MDTHIDFEMLQFAELDRLAKLATEAMHFPPVDRPVASLLPAGCACNVEMLARRRKAARHCGTRCDVAQ